jgi:2-O-methyltransferase
MAKKEIHEWIGELMKDIKNPIVVEIGSNTGTDTVKLAAIPGVMVYAFEPDPRCDLTKMPANVIVNKMAVSDNTGDAVFNLSDSPGYTTPGKIWTYSSSLLKPINHLTVHPHVKFEKQVKVKTIRLDDYCVEKGIKKIDFLWMDTQGAEAKIFAGAGDILKNTRYVYTEYSNDELYEGQQPLVKLIEILKTFEVMDIWMVEPMNVLLKNVQYELKDLKQIKRIIRIDDFPSGIRPILPDLSIFFKIFDEFEKSEIYFYLGIVPDIFRRYVKDSDKEKLKQYKYLIPCQHGYDHRYDEMSRKLIKAKDVFNIKTIGCFNEFEKLQKTIVLKRIRTGKRILELFFGRKVNHYIPVCNIIDNKLIEVLHRMNYSFLFTMPNTTKVKSVNTIMTNFSGRLYELTPETEGCIGLHITWEYDYIKKHGWDKWLGNFKRVFGLTDIESDSTVVESEQAVVESEQAVVESEQAVVESGIPRIANFYWNIETPLSYLRYLTIVTFKYFHPEWVINLWVSPSDTKSITEWTTTRNTLTQDFQKKSNGKNYLNNVIGLGVNILQFDDRLCSVLPPNYISDIARFKTLFDGGWFFDLDQIFTRNFDDLCNYDFVTGVGYMKEYALNGLINCGVIGASKNSVVPKVINEKQMEILKNSSVKGYNELGNLFLNKCFKEDWYNNLNEKHFISSMDYFYPVSTSHEVYLLYEGKMKIDELENNYAVHWYGGHPLSQEFNSKYTEKFALTSTDSISVYCRKLSVLSKKNNEKKRDEIIFCTSISPSKESEARQVKAIESWINAGIPVYSVNAKTEIKPLIKIYPGVIFLATDDVVNVGVKSYIRINTILEFIKKIDCETVCIINSDIEFAESGDLFGKLKQKARDGLVIARRYNYDVEHGDAKMEQGGIDIFAFAKKYIDIIPKEEYCLGQPVWDYWFPLMFSENNIQIYYIDQPLFYHKKHQLGWSRQVWAKNLTRIGKQYGWEEKDPGKISLIMFCRFMAKVVIIK